MKWTRTQILSVAALAAGGMAALGVSSSQGLSHYRRLVNEADRLREQNQLLAEQNAQRRREIEALRTNRRYQEKAVREDLGYVKPGEEWLLLPPQGEPAARPAAKVDTAARP